MIESDFAIHPFGHEGMTDEQFEECAARRIQRAKEEAVKRGELIKVWFGAVEIGRTGRIEILPECWDSLGAAPFTKLAPPFRRMCLSGYDTRIFVDVVKTLDRPAVMAVIMSVQKRRAE